MHEGKVLLARQHVAEGQDFWVVPGGGLKRDEGMLDCARREMAEETGLEIEPLRLLYVGDFFKGDKHVVDTFWLGKIIGGELRRREEEVDSLQFIEVERLKEMKPRPPALAELLRNDIREGFRSPVAYLGKYFKDDSWNREPKGVAEAADGSGSGAFGG